jgi:hypothetical protein
MRRAHAGATIRMCQHDRGAEPGNNKHTETGPRP